MREPRLRVFAGPNGSGKSTIKHILAPELIYTYVNADDLEREARNRGAIDFTPFKVDCAEDAFKAFFVEHPLIVREALVGQAEHFSMTGSDLCLNGMEMNSYHASVIADYIRHKLLERGASFTFETVMSDRSKIDFICKARAAGYRTYLYFVATETPEININRIAIRVSENGHDVAPERCARVIAAAWLCCLKRSWRRAERTCSTTRVNRPCSRSRSPMPRLWNTSSMKYRSGAVRLSRR